MENKKFELSGPLKNTNNRSVEVVILSALFIINISVVAAQMGDPDLRNVNVIEILKKIECNEDINYKNVRIVGDLSFERLPLNDSASNKDCLEYNYNNKYINSSIQIIGSKFDGNIDFSKMIFLKPVNIMQTSFESDAKFEDATFTDKASFSQTRFSKIASFDHSVFEKDSYFMVSEFDEGASFEGSIFQNNSFFDGSKFIYYANIAKADFKEYANFVSTEFHRGADFRKVKFEKRADFNKAKFMEDALFSSANFSKISTFTGSRFLGDAYFSNASFHEDVSFDGVIFEKIAKFNSDALFELKGARFYGNFLMRNAIVHFMQLDDAQFLSLMYLDNSSFDRLSMRWFTIKDHLFFNDQAYQMLIKNYKDLGWFTDADSCYYQYMEELRSRENWGVSKAIYYLAWASCGYGVSILNIFVFPALVILVFSAYFLLRNLPRYPVNAPITEKIKIFIKEIFKLVVFSTLILISAPAEMYPFGEERYRHLIIRHPYVATLERIFGWFLMAIAIVTVSRFMIR